MVDESVFIIDGYFLLDDAEKAFLGSGALFDEQGQDTSVVYGTVRGLLRLRKALGIVRGVLVLGASAADISSKRSIATLLECLRGIGTEVIFEPTASTGSIIDRIDCGRASTWIVTRNRSLMQLITANCGVIIVHDGGQTKVTTERTLSSEYRIRPEQVPDFLAMTEPHLGESLTVKQAQRLLEIHGSLRGALDIPGPNAILIES